MSRFKYPQVGEEVDYPWVVKEKIHHPDNRHYSYMLVNIYSKKEILLGDISLKRILKGKTHVSTIMARRIRRKVKFKC